MSNRFLDLLDYRDGPILADGGMGTMLMAAGLLFGDPPEQWNVLPDKQPHVRAVHRGYLDAGAQIVLTNSFGGNPFRLRLHNLQDRVFELNRAAAALAREEAGEGVVVAGSIGPSGELFEPMGALTYDAAVAGFAVQAAGLAAGGADVLWVETMSDLNEVRAAVEGARRAAPALPVVATMTFDTRGFTMMGVSPADAVAALAELGLAAAGANCGNGPAEIEGVIHGMRQALETRDLRLEASDQEHARTSLKPQALETRDLRLEASDQEHARTSLKPQARETSDLRLEASDQEHARTSLKPQARETSDLRLEASDQEHARTSLKPQALETRDLRLEASDQQNPRTSLKPQASSLKLIAKSNAGLPEIVDGHAIYNGTPKVMAEYARRVRALGASIVGACCGSTPAHIRAMGVALRTLPPLSLDDIELASPPAQRQSPEGARRAREERRARRGV